MRKNFRLFLTIGVVLMFLAAAQVQAATAKDVTIDNNGVLLKGKFYVCDGTGPFPTVLLLHGFPGNETDVLGLGSKLADAGINALTFNYSGTHKSQGLMNMENAQTDIRAAFGFLRRQENIALYKIDTERIILGGWCFGGNMALGYAAGHAEITAVFSLAGNDHGEFFREYARNPQMRRMIDEDFDAMAAPGGRCDLYREICLRKFLQRAPTGLPRSSICGNVPRTWPKRIFCLFVPGTTAK